MSTRTHQNAPEREQIRHDLLRAADDLGVDTAGRILVAPLSERAYRPFWKAARLHIRQFPQFSHPLIATSGDAGHALIEAWTVRDVQDFLIVALALYVGKLGGIPKGTPLFMLPGDETVDMTAIGDVYLEARRIEADSGVSDSAVRCTSSSRDSSAAARIADPR